MQSATIPIPKLMHIGPSCLLRLPELLAPYDFDVSHVVVASGAGPSQALAGQVADGLAGRDVRTSPVVGLVGRLDQAAEMAAGIIRDGATLIIGVGGGRVIDTAKLAAARTGVAFVSVPTSIAHDGIASPVASLRDPEGARRSYAATMPAGIVIDVEVVGDAPVRTLRAGAGDLASNLTALLDWELASRLGEEPFDAFSALIAEYAARPALDLIDLQSPESHEILAKGLLLSGLAMAAAGTSRPCSGAEHLISHSLDLILGRDAALHGEQVALGTLFSAAAHASELLEPLRRLFVRLGLPTAPEALGIARDQFREAFDRAPGTRPGRYTVLSRTPAADFEPLYAQAFGRDAA